MWQEKIFSTRNILPHVLCCHDKRLTNRNHKNMQNILPYFLLSLLTKDCNLDNEFRYLQKMPLQCYLTFIIYKTKSEEMVFCYQNCSNDQEKKIEIRGWWQELAKKFEITRSIYSNNERSEHFLVTECFFNLFLDVSLV